MSRRTELQTRLESLFPNMGVYFQPPESFKLKYPCIVYKLTNIRTFYASNMLYRMKDRYSITVMSKDPDNTIAKDILTNFSLCTFDRRFESSNLYHDILTLYY